jgi:hypothetical protein
MQCDIIQTSPAVYYIEKEGTVKLSASVATVLVQSNAVRRSELNLYVVTHSKLDALQIWLNCR